MLRNKRSGKGGRRKDVVFVVVVFPSNDYSRWSPVLREAGWTSACHQEAVNKCLIALLACTALLHLLNCLYLNLWAFLLLLFWFFSTVLQGGGEVSKLLRGGLVAAWDWPTMFGQAAASLKSPQPQQEAEVEGSRSISSHLYTLFAHGSGLKQCWGNTAQKYFFSTSLRCSAWGPRDLRKLRKAYVLTPQRYTQMTNTTKMDRVPEVVGTILWFQYHSTLHPLIIFSADSKELSYPGYRGGAVGNHWLTVSPQLLWYSCLAHLEVGKYIQFNPVFH